MTGMDSDAATVVTGETAFGAIVSGVHATEGRALLDFARHLGLADEAAADAVQESLLRLWRELQGGTSLADPTAWTYRTCYRLAMDQHRWRRRLMRLLPRLAPEQPTYAGPEDSDRVLVWTAVDQLPARQRHALYLHYAADLTFEAVAMTLGISPSAARTHASRGIATLRERLGTWEEEA